MPQTPEADAFRRHGLSSPTRVDLVQPTLAQYRLAPLAELSRRPNVRLRVYRGFDAGLPNARTDAFDVLDAPLRRVRVGRRFVTWQPRQWQLAGNHGGGRRVLVMTWDVQYATLVPAILRARANGVGGVLWGHGYGKIESPSRRRIRNGVGRLADAVLVYDPDTATALARDGFDAGRVFVARNTMDTEAIRAAAATADERSVEALRRERGLTAGRTFLLVSRAGPERRADLLLQAVAKLRDVEGVTIALVGKGWAELLADEARRLGLAGRVVTPGPLYDEAELARWFAAATAVVLPEEAGLSIVHAMAYAKPVVTHDDRPAHAPEAVNAIDGETALLYRRGDVDSLAGCLRRLINEPTLARDLGTRALAMATGELTVARMVDGMVAAIETAASRR